MSKASHLRRVLCVLCSALICGSALADELLVSAGGGPQPGSSQNNWSASIDYNFFRYERSARQHFLIGASYTHMWTDAASNDEMYAVSIYPQVSFYPEEGSWAYSISPSWAEPFFYFRALGPSYISSDRLGDRQQSNNFAFQAQLGIGVLIKNRNNTKTIVAISWKHFSNANLFNSNDGIDFPIVLNIGIRF